MVFNVTKDAIKGRMAVVNEDVWPLPSVTPKLPAHPKERIGFSDFIKSERQVFADVIKRAYQESNEELGTDIPAAVDLNAPQELLTGLNMFSDWSAAMPYTAHG